MVCKETMEGDYRGRGIRGRQKGEAEGGMGRRSLKVIDSKQV